MPSNSCSSCGQEDGDCYENCKESDEGNDENRDCLEDNGEHYFNEVNRPSYYIDV